MVSNRVRELRRIDEQLQRIRFAAFFCFCAAAFAYGFVMSERRRVAEESLQSMASLGAAFWVVAVVLMFFVAYYRVQRRRIEG
jgi:preprotein translocase subunit SecG